MLILIYGITGMVGQATAKTALHAGHHVRGISRHPDKLDKDLLDRLDSFIKMEDIYDMPALDEAVKGVDAVISAATYTPHALVDGQILLLRASERAGVNIFHAASWNYDWTKLNPGECEPYDGHICFYNYARIASSIKPIYGFTGQILEYILYAPQSNPLDKKSRTWSFAGHADYRWTLTMLDDLAKYTILAVTAPDAKEGGPYYVDSFRASPRELAQAYEEQFEVKLELKHLGGKKEVDQMLRQFRASTPAYKCLDVPAYHGVTYAANLIRGAWDYESVDSNGRWRHAKRNIGPKEWFAEHPDLK